MKNMKRIASLLLIFVLVFSLAMPALAATPGKITITNNNQNISIQGKTYTVYRVFDLSYSAANQAYAYSLNAKFAALPTYLKNAGIITTDTPAAVIAYLEAQTANSAALDAFAAAVRSFITANSITSTASQLVNLTNPGVYPQQVTINVDDLGYYIVMGDAAVPGAPGEVVSACALTTTDTDASVNVKADVPKIEKKVWDAADESIGEDPADDAWQDYTDHTIGETVRYKLTSNVPNMTGYTDYKFIVHDILSAGLTLDGGSFEIYIGDPTVTANKLTATQYTVNTPGSAVPSPGTGNFTFDIVFTNFLQWAGKAGQPVTIFYTAKLNKGAIIGAPGNPNTVNLEYSNNPYLTTSTNRTPDDTVYVFTFGIKPEKYAMHTNGTTKLPLAGAEFELYTDAAATANVVWVELKTPGNATDPAVYTVVAVGGATGPAGSTKTMVTPASGLLTIEGLDEGKYYFKETKAPEGYNILTDPVEITIDAEYNADGTFNKLKNVTAGPYVPVGVENQTGTEFPETGGTGRIIFYVLGALLMLGAAVVLVARKKVSSTK